MWKPSHPFWQVSLDVMGPLPESIGQKNILLIGDQFSKWYEAVAMANQEAKTVAQAFVDNWITKFGCPVNLHSDKGTNFCRNSLQSCVGFWALNGHPPLLFIQRAMR